MDMTDVVLLLCNESLYPISAQVPTEETEPGKD